ncbi:hypothetical protein AAFF_G00175110 [Aldrovandia affinis]|uniref:Uncharacterized protein n=1 Tax=Aldrovandia affinis TaxID=143900 RepID=A0AAD7RLM9_9TELE|nr:hypothetical protein AAFF_G00175110 [Aldrovandia affinis]
MKGEQQLRLGEAGERLLLAMEQDKRSSAGSQKQIGSDLVTTADPPAGGCYGSGSRHLKKGGYHVTTSGQSNSPQRMTDGLLIIIPKGLQYSFSKKSHFIQVINNLG